MWRSSDHCLRALGALVCLSGVAVHPACADEEAVREFYAGPGKVIRMIIGSSVGGGYDQLSRVIAKNMARHIPGKPTIISENMPAGGGIVAANYVGKLAPRDGTILTIVTQGIPVAQALGSSPQFTADLREMNWISNVVFSNPVLAVWHTSPTKTLDDAKARVTTLGANGVGSVMQQFPSFYNNVLGTKFKIITGYVGGPEIDLAMERGEVEGRGSNTFMSYMASNPDWIPRKIIVPLIQIGLEKDPGLPDTPLLRDQPVKAEDKPVVEFMSKSATVGRPFGTTPGVPADRLAARRKAFDDMIGDPEFVADVERQRLEVRPMPGAQLATLVRDLIEAPAAVRNKVKAYTEITQ